MAQYITAGNGQFLSNGQPYYPIGVNYFPLYHTKSIAPIDNNGYTYHWLMDDVTMAGGQVLPLYTSNTARIETDLAAFQSAGLTSISIQYRDQLAGGKEARFCHNVNDFLTRAKNHNLTVNMYISSCARGNAPDGAAARDYCVKTISDCDFSENPTIFGYDVHWEPVIFFNSSSSIHTSLNPYWQTWLVEQYRTIDNAVTQLGTSNLNLPTISSTGDFCQSTVNRKVSAFRQFFDDYRNSQYYLTYRAMKSADPNHMISFRRGGLYDCTWGGLYDRRTLGAAIFDFVSPESYDVKDENDTFWTQYNTFLNKPILYAEYGSYINPLSNIADGFHNCTLGTLSQKESCQAAHVESQTKLWASNGANGGFIWWFIGQQETDRDWGIAVESSNVFRTPITQRLPTFQSLFATQSKYIPNVWVTIDRDSTANSSNFIANIRNEFNTLKNQGRKPGIRSAFSGLSTRSATSYQCVGYIGSQSGPNSVCPKKGANSIIDTLEINAYGDEAIDQWQKIPEGNGAVTVFQNIRPLIRGTLFNQGEITWSHQLSCSPWPSCTDGYVYLGARTDPYLRASLLADTATGKTGTISGRFGSAFSASGTYQLQLVTSTVGWFGDVANLNVTVVPQPQLCNRCSTVKGCENIQYRSNALDCSTIDSQTVNTTDCTCPTNVSGNNDRCLACVPTPTITPRLMKAADANGDGRVDGLDYVVWLNNYGSTNTGSANGDFNSDGRIDGLDYVTWLSGYGR